MLLAVNYFLRKSPSQIFAWVLNKPLCNRYLTSTVPDVIFLNSATFSYRFELPQSLCLCLLRAFNCVRALRPLRAFLFYVHCLPSYFYVSYVPSSFYVLYLSLFFTCRTYILFFTCLMCSHFFTCLTCLIFYYALYTLIFLCTLRVLSFYMP